MNKKPEFNGQEDRIKDVRNRVARLVSKSAFIASIMIIFGSICLLVVSLFYLPGWQIDKSLVTLRDRRFILFFFFLAVGIVVMFSAFRKTRPWAPLLQFLIAPLGIVWLLGWLAIDGNLDAQTTGEAILIPLSAILQFYVGVPFIAGPAVSSIARQRFSENPLIRKYGQVTAIISLLLTVPLAYLMVRALIDMLKGNRDPEFSILILAAGAVVFWWLSCFITIFNGSRKTKERAVRMARLVVIFGIISFFLLQLSVVVIIVHEKLPVAELVVTGVMWIPSIGMGLLSITSSACIVLSIAMKRQWKYRHE